MAKSRPGSTRLGWLIFPILISMYLLPFSATFRADDEHIFAARAQSLALRGDLEAPQVYGNQRVRQLELWGDQATQVEPGLSFVGAALYWVGVKLGWGGQHLLFAANIYFTTLTAFLIYLTCRTLGRSEHISFLAALGFGLSTWAMPYVLTFYRDPLVMMMAALIFFGWARLEQGVGPSWLATALVFAGIVFGVLVKNTLLAALPALLIGTLLSSIPWRHRSDGFDFRLLLIGAGALLALSLVLSGTGILARFSWDYYSSVLSHFWTSLDGQVLWGALGPWLSPAQSIFLFAPMLWLLFVPAAWRSAQKGFLASALSFALLLGFAQALFYGEAWSGGIDWGLRFMLPALPPLVVLASSGLEEIWSKGGWWVGAAVSLFCVGFILQQSASWVGWDFAYERWLEAGLDPLQPSADWSFRYFAPVHQVQGLLDPGNWDAAWIRMLALKGRLFLFLPIMLLLVAAAGVRVTYASMTRKRRASSASWRLGLMVTAMALPLLQAPFLQMDPAMSGHRLGYRQLQAELEVDMQLGDVLVVDSYGTSLWRYFMNSWDLENQWYSLPYEVPSSVDAENLDSLPAASTVDLFEEVLSAQTRLFYLTSSESPDFGLGRELRWLDSHAERRSTWVVEGDPVLYLYSYQSTK